MTKTCKACGKEKQGTPCFEKGLGEKIFPFFLTSSNSMVY